MLNYRVTIRYGGAPPRYELLDLEAEDLRAVLRETAHRLSEDVSATADLAEIRVQATPDSRAWEAE